VGYLGYDRDRLAVLAGALEALAAERLARADRPSRWAEEAAARHRRAIGAVSAFADRIDVILHGDPLGRYRGVCLDPADLSQWTLHHGGAWATVTDPTPAAGDAAAGFAVTNARMLATELTPAHLRELLAGDGRRAAPLLRYLARVGTEPAAGRAFLNALGPARFAALLDVAGERGLQLHQPIGPLPGAETADDVAAGLAGVWATARGTGRFRSPAWDGAALGGTLYAASRALAVAARTPGALAPAELARWGQTQWNRLIVAFGAEAAPWPQLVGDQVLGALSYDGRAARTFVLGLAPDAMALGALLTGVAASPAASGRLLLASTDPSSVTTPADDDEVRRSMQEVLRAVGRLLDARRVSFPHVDGAGQVEVVGTGWVLPTDLGTYVGRYDEKLIDPDDGLEGAHGSIASAAWPGWGQREVAGLLERLVADPVVAAQLLDAAIARYLSRLGQLELTGGGADETVENAAFVTAAVGAVVRDHELRHVIDDGHRFEQQVAGVDLVATVAGVVGPDLVTVPAEAWAWSSRLTGVAGQASPGAIVLAPFRPIAVRDALAQDRAAQALDGAVLEQAAASIALAQRQRAGGLHGPAPTVPVEPDAQVRQLVRGTKPGDNANAPAAAYADELESWVDEHRDEPAGRTVEQLIDSVGDAAARGTAWVA
jgi:hypothetical protein